MVMFLAPAEGEFDLGALVPSVETLLGKLDLLMRILVMAGPLCLFGFGLFFFLYPPKEANYKAGYRFRYGMSRIEVWQFMQRLAGMVYGCLGLVLTVVMGILCTGFASLQAPDMVWKAVRCLLWEIGLVTLAGIAINVTIVVLFNRKGYRRGTQPKEEE